MCRSFSNPKQVSFLQPFKLGQNAVCEVLRVYVGSGTLARFQICIYWMRT